MSLGMSLKGIYKENPHPGWFENCDAGNRIIRHPLNIESGIGGEGKRGGSREEGGVRKQGYVSTKDKEAQVRI